MNWIDKLAVSYTHLLAGAQIAAIGQGTAKVLEDRGILVDLIPEVYDGESLGEALAVKLQGEMCIRDRSAASRGSGYRSGKSCQ